MLTLALSPGHDGSAACIDGSELLFHLESEKNSFPRHVHLKPGTVVRALSWMDRPPDVIAVTGGVRYHNFDLGIFDQADVGYFGVASRSTHSEGRTFLGRPAQWFSTTHERAHILCCYGLSPFPQGEPCYALVWEGGIGTFYEIDERARITIVEQVMEQPGKRYEFLYYLGDLEGREPEELSSAGKLMALAGFSSRSEPTPVEREVIEYILRAPSISYRLKSDLRLSGYLGIGVETPAFRELAGKFSDALFDRFFAVALRRLKKGWPLLIGGGCGLNCEWNRRWRDCGLFRDVFVPPCPNDSGIAIGTAIDAKLHFTGNAKVSWDVYAGEPFVVDAAPAISDFTRVPFDAELVAKLLHAGLVVAWAAGRAESGPRALGNRSLFASPFSSATRDKLNQIKQREWYRPVAPICLEEDVSEHFDWKEPSPHMLYFQKVLTPKLEAITHVDGTARVQTVSEAQNPRVHRLLREFKALTGYGVLCNTSLNFKQRGFINQLSDLFRYCSEQGVDAFVAGDALYMRREYAERWVPPSRSGSLPKAKQ